LVLPATFGANLMTLSLNHSGVDRVVQMFSMCPYTSLRAIKYYE
jgi:hypothetical protein